MAKNKLAKFAEMETLENVFQPTHEEVFRTDYKLKEKWGEQVFGNDHPIVLEVGCGKGVLRGIRRTLSRKELYRT